MLRRLSIVRVVGIDPGTKIFDFCGLENGKMFLDVAVPSAEIGEDPMMLIADGLAGGRYGDLVETLRIREARGIDGLRRTHEVL
ncbi:MAG: hypothetical protein ACE5GD_02810 [Candidatus Geothermarchaeales archaeon]